MPSTSPPHISTDGQPRPQEPRPTLSSHSSGSYHSPLRHHQRSPSLHQAVKETSNAHSEYSNSQDDGTSQLRINQYLIRQEIGRGSFGAVHLATDQYEQEYAVKEFSKTRLRRRAQSNLLRRPRTSRPGPLGMPPVARQILASTRPQNSFELIKEEIAVMKKLHHPNLVSLIEVLDDPDEDSLFMVLEMCKKGVIMKVAVDEPADPYDEESCRTWFRDLMLGIEYLHHQGIVHRDIKPDNCLLTSDDTLKLVDFGVSEMFEKDTEMKIAKSAGSPAFMAPELCTVKQGDVFGKPADIWSMGVTLFCLRFGQVPFREAAVLDMYNAIIHDPAPIPAQCDDTFRGLISRLLEKDPSKRITMEELREHSWVTKNGLDPLLPASENCSEMITPPTDSEMNAAITSNVGSVIAVMKAAHHFKGLLQKRRPGLFHSILGSASSIVQPPHSIAKSDPTQIDSHQPISASAKEVELARAIVKKESGHDQDGELNAELDRLADCVRGDGERDSSLMSKSFSPRSLRKSRTEPVGNSSERHLPRGHAHDPLEDVLYLNIGQGPETRQEQGDFAVCESPAAADNVNVYEEAYKEEVNKIRREQGRAATVYLTRRIDRKWAEKIDQINAYGDGQSPDTWKGAAKTGFANMVGKALESARDRVQKSPENGAFQAGKDAKPKIPMRDGNLR